MREPLTTTLPKDCLDRVVERIAPGASLMRSWPLKGGVSYDVTGLEVVTASGRSERYVLRQSGDADIKAQTDILQAEFRLLGALASRGLDVPRAMYFGEAGFVFEHPWLVLSYIEGDIDAYPGDRNLRLERLAKALARIHGIDVGDPEFAWLDDQFTADDTFLKLLPKTSHGTLPEHEIRAILPTYWPPRVRNPDALLHGDFWSGNILWKDAEIVGVIDWEDALRGDPLIDLSVARLELCWSDGYDAATQFTACYAAVTDVDFTDLPVWDLMAALRPIHKISDWGLSSAQRQAQDAHHWTFTRRAIEALQRRR